MQCLYSYIAGSDTQEYLHICKTNGRKKLFLYMIVIFCIGHSFSSGITQMEGMKIRQVRRKYICIKSPPSIGEFTAR